MAAPPASRSEGCRKYYGKVKAVDGIDLRSPPARFTVCSAPTGPARPRRSAPCWATSTPPTGPRRCSAASPRPNRRPAAVSATCRAICAWSRGRRLPRCSTSTPTSAAASIATTSRTLCARLSLDASRKFGDLSKGNRQKVGVVQAVMHRPDVLVLDEPTSGLDPLMQREVLRLVSERRDEGAAVLFSSHIIFEVEEAADRVGHHARRTHGRAGHGGGTAAHYGTAVDARAVRAIRRGLGLRRRGRAGQRRGRRQHRRYRHHGARGAAAAADWRNSTRPTSAPTRWCWTTSSTGSTTHPLARRQRQRRPDR